MHRTLTPHFPHTTLGRTKGSVRSRVCLPPALVHAPHFPHTHPTLASLTYPIPQRVEHEAVCGAGWGSQQDVERVLEEVAVQVGPPAIARRSRRSELLATRLERTTHVEGAPGHQGLRWQVLPFTVCTGLEEVAVQVGPPARVRKCGVSSVQGGGGTEGLRRQVLPFTLCTGLEEGAAQVGPPARVRKCGR